jgi:hypothetical protein
MDDYKSIGIYLEKEEKERVDTFLIHVDHLFRLMLDEKQKRIYDAYKATQIFRDNGMTIKGYLEFIRVTKELTSLTGIPFSLEADFAGLDSLNEWDAMITKAFEAAKSEQKRKKRKTDK